MLHENISTIPRELNFRLKIVSIVYFRLKKKMYLIFSSFDNWINLNRFQFKIDSDANFSVNCADQNIPFVALLRNQKIESKHLIDGINTFFYRV